MSLLLHEILCLYLIQILSIGTSVKFMDPFRVQLQQPPGDALLFLYLLATTQQIRKRVGPLLYMAWCKHHLVVTVDAVHDDFCKSAITDRHTESRYVKLFHPIGLWPGSDRFPFVT